MRRQQCLLFLSLSMVGTKSMKESTEIRSCSSADDTFYETLLCHDKGIFTLTHCL